jgi:chemotaxis protein CheC
MDALTEAFNLSLGEAAATFSAIVREEIELSSRWSNSSPAMNSPVACRAPRTAAPRTACAGSTSTFHRRRLCHRCLLLFPEQGSLEIVRRMLGDDTSIEHITELEQDALAEIGNIIINSCMSSLADLFGSEIIGSLPRVQCSSIPRLLDDKSPDNLILVARIGMSMSAHNLSGFVLFLMDVPSIDHFMAQVSRLFGLPEALPEAK